MLSFVDYIVVGILLVLPLAVGCFYVLCKGPNYEKLAFGEKTLGIFSIAISTVVGFIAINQNILSGSGDDAYYSNGAHIFTKAFATILAIPLSMVVFVPVLYRMKMLSVFEYLEFRFESVCVRWMAACLFIIASIIISAFILQVPCVLMEDVFNIPKLISIVVIGLCTIAYSALGGLTSIVFGHIFQFMVIISAILVVTVTGIQTGDGFSQVLNHTIMANPLFKFDFSVDPFSNTNDLNILTGFGFSLMCLYGIHQSQFQRYSSPSTHAKAQISMGITLLLNILVLAALTLMTLSILDAYCTSKNEISIEHGQEVEMMLLFITQSLQKYHGVQGLIIAAIISSIIGMMSATLNSLAVITFEDFLRKIKKFQTCSNTTYANVLRAFVIFYGLVITSISLIPIELESSLRLAMDVFLITFGILGTAFIAGILLPFINKYGIGIGIIIGQGLMMAYNSQKYWRGSHALALPTSSSNRTYQSTTWNEVLPICYSNISSSSNYSFFGGNSELVETSGALDEMLLSVTEVLHPSIGSLVAIIIAIAVSILTGGCCQIKRLNRGYIHPILHIFLSKNDSSLDEFPSHPLLWDQPMTNSHRNFDRLSGGYNNFNSAKGTSSHSLFHQRYEAISLDDMSRY